MTTWRNLVGSQMTTYEYSTNSFSIFNAGDVVIDPRERGDMEITFTGASTNLTISNLTTGDTWVYTGTTDVDDVIRITGIRATKNSLSIFRDTNRALITLARGWNQFSIIGATGALNIKFNFRFLYL